MSDSQIFNGRYEIIRPIARGGMAEVFLAHDNLLDRQVALKKLFPELSTDKSFVERFRREAQAAANLTHPNIVSIFDWGEEDTAYFIVMEYIDGTPLSQMIHEKGQIEPARAAAIAADVAAALSFAHGNGVVHRDVKPGNILINKAGQVKVTDFGIARARDTTENLTQTGAVMGTATYFSPEQAQGMQLDGRSDVYSLGVVLYEMLAGKPPFSGENPVAIATKHVNGQPQPLHELNSQVSPTLEKIVSAAMAKNPNDRYATANDFASDLKKFASGGQVRPPEPATQAVSAAAVKKKYDQGPNATAAMSGMATQAVVMPKSEKSNKVFAITLFVMVAALIALIFTALHIVNSNVSSTVTVQDVRGKSKDEAEKILKDQGLKVERYIVQADSSDKDTVIAQEPGANTKVKKGTGIILTISAGQEQVDVPSVVGLSRVDAETQLSNLGFQVTTNSEASDKPEDQVISQDPSSGKAAKGSTVVITVSSGPDTTPIPDVTGVLRDKAITQLGNAGFTNITAQDVYDPSVPAGVVISINPPAGTKVAKTTAITIKVSKGPQPTTTSAPPSTTASSI